MRSVLMLAAVLRLAPATALAQGPWGNVKSWTGTMTIEATDLDKSETGSSKMTYRATGEFTIVDDMLPDGSHMQWPMPSVETLSDPKQAESANARWQSRVVASYDAKGLDEQGGPWSVTCTADNKQASLVGVTINPTAPTYVMEVEAPQAVFRCTGATHSAPNGRLRQVHFRLSGPRGEPGPVSGTETFTVETSKITVTYRMAPSK